MIELCEELKAKGADVVGMAETNLEWRADRVQSDFLSVARKTFCHTRGAFSTSQTKLGSSA
jgi:hypothetical protein